MNTYISTSINSSAVLAELTGSAIENGACRAVKYDAQGRLTLCSTAGEPALGVAVAQTGALNAGEVMTVQIKDTGMWLSGAAIAKGALLTTDDQGRAIPAVSGSFVLGMAVSGCDAGNTMVQVQLCKCGFMA